MTSYEWGAWKEYLQFEIYRLKYKKIDRNGKEKEVLYNISQLDLHHLYSGGDIDRMIKAKKRNIGILGLLRDSMINIVPMEHHSHIAQEKLVKYSYEDFLKIYDYFVDTGEAGLKTLKILNNNNNDLSKEGRIELLLIIIEEIFGEVRSPFDMIEG